MWDQTVQPQKKVDYPRMLQIGLAQCVLWLTRAVAPGHIDAWTRRRSQCRCQPRGTRSRERGLATIPCDRGRASSLTRAHPDSQTRDSSRSFTSSAPTMACFEHSVQDDILPWNPSETASLHSLTKRTVTKRGQWGQASALSSHPHGASCPLRASASECAPLGTPLAWCAPSPLVHI